MHILTCNAPKTADQIVVKFNPESKQLEFWTKHEGYSVLAGHRYVSANISPDAVKLIQDVCADYFNVGNQRAREVVREFLLNE
jgi:hypothetical protein